MAVYLVILSYAAWVVQQPPGKFTSLGHAKRVSPAFIAPGLAYAFYALSDKLRALLDRRADTQIRRLETKLRKMVSELKDTTRYQKTQSLLQKYDPDQPPPSPAPGQLGPRPGSNSPQKVMMTPRGRAASAAATAVTGAGAALSSVVGQAFGHLADRLIAEDPMVVNMLKEVQGKVVALEQRNRLLEAENRQLREERGLTPRTLLFALPPPDNNIGQQHEVGQVVGGAIRVDNSTAGGAGGVIGVDNGQSSSGGEVVPNSNNANAAGAAPGAGPFATEVPGTDQEINTDKDGEDFAFGSPVALTPERESDPISDSPKESNLKAASPVPPLKLP